MKFTRGPWSHSTINGETWVQSQDTTYICKLYEASNLKEANALLIAAAPEMYGWLKRLADAPNYDLLESLMPALDDFLADLGLDEEEP